MRLTRYVVFVGISAAFLAGMGGAAVRAGEPDDYDHLPMPDRQWTGPYQKELTARSIRKALRAQPLFEAAAPANPTPIGDDRRWCKHIGAAWAIIDGCRWDTLDPAVCDRAAAAKKLDDGWYRTLHGKTFDFERECRDSAYADINDREEN